MAPETGIPAEEKGGQEKILEYEVLGVREYNLDNIAFMTTKGMVLVSDSILSWEFSNSHDITTRLIIKKHHPFRDKAILVINNLLRFKQTEYLKAMGYYPDCGIAQGETED